ncbi:DUF348 domain-containing protein [Heliorestis acidaminivorans]|uniref:DUF348 domain-containing protein n=1 Tax=Heliorestis acidaminivorans TaxID=553427 RepID=A0A6I0ESX7_9FIRM|nr:3D domain-containing protein [Heliorestis acidaminivorans]KAB2953018.1 DUF348 domain-containing protein [Heliorestis acidaminivorans]
MPEEATGQADQQGESLSWIEKWNQKLDKNAKIGTILGAVVVFFLLTFGVYSWLENEVTIHVDGEEVIVNTFSKTVSALLAEASIDLGEMDKVEPALSATISDGMVVHIERAFPVTVIADGESHSLLTTTVAVEDLLEQLQIELGTSDRVEPPLVQLVTEPEEVRVIRVTFEEVREEQSIPYTVEQTADPNLEKGLRRIASRGRNGVAQSVVRVTYEDGHAVHREVLSQNIVREPVNQVVAMGTIDRVSRGGMNFRFREARQMQATAYTHTGRNTASGVYPQVGMVAVDTSVIPMGTRLYVEGYGFATAADRGSAIRGDKIDLFMETHAEARRWGIRTVKVYVLE